jgi:hypothetical protein
MAWQTFGALAAGNQPLSLFDTLAQQIAQNVVIPCTAAGTNDISLTVNANGPPVTSYNNFALFSFVAANNSTGNCRLQVASIGLLNLYTPGGTVQAASGSIASGTLYVVAFQSSLNAGAGGFVIVSSTPSSLTLPVSVANGGTGDTSLTAYAVLCGGTTSTNPVQPIASVGTAGNVLTSNGAGALPTFQAASAGGWVLLATLTASSSATLSDTTHITSTYNVYAFVLENILPATNAVGLDMQVSENAGASWITTNYRSYVLGGDSSATGTFAAATLAGGSDTITSGYTIIGQGFAPVASNTANLGVSGVVYFSNPNSTTDKIVWGNTAVPQSGTVIGCATIAGMYTGDQNVINGVRFLFGAGNIASGKIRVYGVSA